MNSLFISAAGVVTVLNTVLSAVFYALLAALAISFHTYIKKYTTELTLVQVRLLNMMLGKALFPYLLLLL